MEFSLKPFLICICVMKICCEGQPTDIFYKDGQTACPRSEINCNSGVVNFLMEQSSSFDKQINELIHLTQNMTDEIVILKNELSKAANDRRLLKIEIEELKASNCGSLPSPHNGSVFAIFNANGSIATYSCDPGFNLQGNELRICNKSGIWSGSDPTCKEDEIYAVNSYQVQGKTVSCDPAELSVLSNTYILTCLNIKVDGYMRFCNHDTCTTAWKSWSSVPQHTKSFLDVPSLCGTMVSQLSRTASYTDAQVNWNCDTSQTRASFVNQHWGTRSDNGYLMHLKCVFIN